MDTCSSSLCQSYCSAAQELLYVLVDRSSDYSYAWHVHIHKINAYIIIIIIIHKRVAQLYHTICLICSSLLWIWLSIMNRIKRGGAGLMNCILVDAARLTLAYWVPMKKCFVRVTWKRSEWPWETLQCTSSLLLSLLCRIQGTRLAWMLWMLRHNSAVVDNLFVGLLLHYQKPYCL